MGKKRKIVANCLTFIYILAYFKNHRYMQLLAADYTTARCVIPFFN